jgi:uncharacterized protein YjiS (DUF1127 family)
MSHLRLNLKPPIEILGTRAGRPATRWRHLLRAITTTASLWRHRRAMRRELESLDLRTLADIGIAPGTVEYEMQQPFWRPLREWRD